MANTNPISEFNNSSLDEEHDTSQEKTQEKNKENNKLNKRKNNIKSWVFDYQI
jgi:hypothetical protein